MDAYPEDLLVGVFPLVFAVNTIHSKDEEGEPASSPSRTPFDRFLDALAACLMEKEEEKDKKRSVSLFRADSDDSDDEGLEDLSHANPNRRSFSSGIYPGFNSNKRLANSEDDASTSFAKALTHGQGFFERARIEAVSMRHGFPPSKDPEGTNGVAYLLPQAVKRKSLEQATNILTGHPLDGILPAGWLEKHVHALPSVILVVCTVSGVRAKQEKQDSRLLETVEHLRHSLGVKRNCSIQVVGLMDDDITQLQADVWSKTLSSQMVDPELSTIRSTDPIAKVSLLRSSSDIQATDTGMPTSFALRQLHRKVRDASMDYYLNQARRNKEKLSKLRSLDLKRRTSQTVPVQLLPLVVRYYFKVAIFYEIQWKHEKALRYMSEGYKHVVKYFQHLVSKGSNTDESELTVLDNQVDTHTGEDGAMEISISDSKSFNWSKIVPVPPDDMIEQCRTIADWMNLKILTAGLASRTGNGLVAASYQWRRHSAVFCSHLMFPSLPKWRDWSYIARQRLIVSQLVERYPPSTLADQRGMMEEDILRCSPWRNYEAAAEATLQLARSLQAATKATDELNKEDGPEDPMRQRYVGSFASDSSAPTLDIQSKIPHRENALNLMLRCISLFERELESEKRGFYAEDDFKESSSSRTGARLYYLVGGLLLGMNRHEEAVAKLTIAVKYARGWRELEFAIRRMLSECYEKHIPSELESNGNSNALASMILDSYFNAEMSSSQLRRALDHFSSISGGGSLKWFHKAGDDEMTSLPFSFAVSFPGRTHATAGDTVEASVLVRSNLDYAVHVNSVTLLSLAGKLPIPSVDLLGATNASEGSEGGIIIQAATAITISTQIPLPKDISVIASDDSGNGGEQQGVAGKGSFAKSARPRTAGISAAGGARLVSEELLEPGSRSTQGWNMSFLGGKPLRCDGLELVFYPVQAERSSVEKVTFIELTMEKKKSRTEANIKRTPFEEENYIASAWARPQSLPLSSGPRSLRVLEPTPHVVVSNITEAVTSGKAIEGTVNRIVLKIQAGPHERCEDMKFSVSCFNVLVTPSGTTKRLVDKKESEQDVGSSLDINDPKLRAPILVSEDCASSCPTHVYDIPDGWIPQGTGQRTKETSISSLDRGECSYIHFDLYRPSPTLHVDFSAEDSNAASIGDTSLCKTDFYVNIAYRQERPSLKKRRPPRRARRRRRSTTLPPDENEDTHPEDTEGTTDDEEFDNVSLEFVGSVIWTAAFTASFEPGFNASNPAGSRHPSNSIETDSKQSSRAEYSLIDGQTLTAKCSLEPDAGFESMKTRVHSVRFTSSSIEAPAVDFSPAYGFGENLLAVEGGECTPAILTLGSKLSTAFSARARLSPGFLRGGVSASLGAIEVDWSPIEFQLPEETFLSSKLTFGARTSHGPLVLSAHSTSRFRGPSCYVESAPFEAKIISMPASPSVVHPFDVCYLVENKTDLQQQLSVQLDAPSLGDGSRRDTLLVAGTMNEELSLGPKESYTLRFTFLATRPGPLNLPCLQIGSKRYNSWIVKEGAATKNQVFVLP